MSHDAPEREGPPMQGGAGMWRLVAAAGAAAVILGGGLYAWTSMSPSEPEPELAYGDPGGYQSDPLDHEFSESARSTETPDAEAEPAAAPAAAPARRRQIASARVEPEEQVIGVTAEPSADVLASEAADEDAIVVPGYRRPQWVREPSAYRLSSAYPTRALERGREGEASIRCVVQENGSLDCVRASEAPANAGFGRAALRVSRMFRHATERADGGSAVGTPVNLRILFRIAEEDSRRPARS